MKFPKSLSFKLEQRNQNNALRKLPEASHRIDFASNDYLGFSISETLFDSVHSFLIENKYKINGATGSRLISGNHSLYPLAEEYIANFHQSESALIFNSGYDANLGFFSSVPQRNDIILYDELCHASIRDGIQLSHAKSFKFEHNDVENLEERILHFQSNTNTTIYVVLESVYSMDGDSPNLEEIIHLCEKYYCYVVIDEAHALGVFGDKGQGLVQSMQLQDKVFARIVTFGKALGCHGAAILGNRDLRDYLVNFARSFIYTTGLSPHSVATIYKAYQILDSKTIALQVLKENIAHFNQEKLLLGLKGMFVYSKSAIQCAIIPGNERVKTIANQLHSSGYDVKPILSPTVPEGQERLRFCIHSFNSKEEITNVLQSLAKLIF